jgi:hypothetical protein
VTAVVNTETSKTYVEDVKPVTQHVVEDLKPVEVIEKLSSPQPKEPETEVVK